MLKPSTIPTPIGFFFFDVICLSHLFKHLFRYVLVFHPDLFLFVCLFVPTTLLYAIWVTKIGLTI